MIIFLGNYRAAVTEARHLQVHPNSYKVACSPGEAERLLMGRDPDTTDVIYVHGSHRVVTPTVRALVARLELLRYQADEAAPGELGDLPDDDEDAPRSAGPSLLTAFFVAALAVWIFVPLLIVVFG